MKAKEATEAKEAPGAAAAAMPRRGAQLSEAMGRTGGDSFATMRGMPRRRVTFTMPAEVCAPGIFDEDFDLTLESLTSAQELEGARKARGDSNVLAMIFTRTSIVGFNGTPLNVSEGQLDWLWEAIGGAGRQIVMGVFTQIGTPSADAQKNVMSGLRLE